MIEQFMTELGFAELGILAGFLGIAFAGLLVVLIAIYVYSSFALMTLAKRLKTENAWIAWIPIVNLYLVTQIAKKEWWWALIIVFANIVPFVGWLISVGSSVYMYFLIAERRKYPGWTGALMVIPFVNLIYLGFLAWGE
jgi:hypothetical protein